MTTQRSGIFELPYPPSANSYLRHTCAGGKPIVYRTEAARRFVEAVKTFIGPRMREFEGRLAVTIWVWFPDRLRRDLDNVLKVLLDACTTAGIWGDDRQIERLAIRRRGVVRDGRILLRVKELDRRLF